MFSRVGGNKRSVIAPEQLETKSSSSQTYKIIDQEKLDTWKKLVELENDPTTNNVSNAENFDEMIEILTQKLTEYKATVYMNLSCLIDINRHLVKKQEISLETCAYLSEGQFLGVMAPPGSDSEALLEALSSVTKGTEITVKDLLSLYDFCQLSSSSLFDVTNSDETVGTFLLTAYSHSSIGTLIQNKSSSSFTPESTLEMGGQTFSTAVRSVLILEKIHELDAHSFYIVLKKIRKIMKSARMSIVMFLRSPEEEIGLFPLLDTIIIASEEGLGYFGYAKHLESYCKLVGFECPSNIHVTQHFRSILQTHAPSKYDSSQSSLDTPFTIRYQLSPLAKFHKKSIDIGIGLDKDKRAPKHEAKSIASSIRSLFGLKQNNEKFYYEKENEEEEKLKNAELTRKQKTLE
eukprot:c16078_g1_i1.p1 GENE.c16078_g1_i1~~c16078_g1_i1.p1  ORF type:complete len:415 (+),score=151.43 c16078_g1_i1:31-1245(+)